MLETPGLGLVLPLQQGYNCTQFTLPAGIAEVELSRQHPRPAVPNNKAEMNFELSGFNFN